MAKRKEFVINKKSSGQRSRRSHSPAFKAKVAFVGLRENKTIAERKAMMDGEYPLSVTRQARLLEISRGAVYYPAMAHQRGRSGAHATH